MKRVLQNNGLGIVTFALFVLFLAGQSVAGWMTFSDQEKEHGGTPPGYTAYLTSAHFVEATSENWESEFLQMGMFVLFTVWLRQKGSPESKKVHGKEAVDREPSSQGTPGSGNTRNTPAPVRMGGLALALYSHSLSITLLALFVVSFMAHVWSGAIEYSQDQIAHGGEAISALGYLATSRLWFESFQNWQSELLSVFTLAILGIFLREKGSPESKPVDAPHDQTGASDDEETTSIVGHRPMPRAA